MFQYRNTGCAVRTLCVATASAFLVAGPGGRRAIGQTPDPAARREDIAMFERGFLAVDRAYTPAARVEAERRIGVLRRDAGTISNAKFVVTLSQIVALADNGHTALLSPGSAPELGRVGVRLTPFGEDFYVVRAVPDHADLLGGRLLAIDGVSIAQLRDSARTLRGGIPAWRDRGAPALFEVPAFLNAMGLTRSALVATYRFRLRDGSTREVALAPLPGGPSWQHSGPVGMVDPGDDGTGWKTLLTPSRAPWSLQGFSQLFRRRDAPELDAIVIQLHANIDAGGESIAAFLAASDSLRRSWHRKNVVLDMRFNGGGNLQLTRDFVSSLPKQLDPDARIVVLTSPWTFSAAISTTGYLKQAGGERVVLVGEAVGDRLQFFAEGQPIALPHSGVMVLMATERHDYLTGCKDFPDCHPPVRRFPIAVASLAPTVVAPWTIEAYASGRDPGMDAVARVLKHN